MLIVVRHGRTEANASGLLLGRRLDPDLDELGRRQAAALATALPGEARIVSSPLRRAQETAAAFGRPVDIDERCVEIELDLGTGAESVTILGGDLTHEYVSENADYRS